MTLWHSFFALLAEGPFNPQLLSKKYKNDTNIWRTHYYYNSADTHSPYLSLNAGVVFI